MSYFIELIAQAAQRKKPCTNGDNYVKTKLKESFYDDDNNELHNHISLVQDEQTSRANSVYENKCKSKD